MSNQEPRKSQFGKGYDFLGYLIIFLGGLLVLVFIVAFVHDLFTGQLPSGGGGGFEGDGGHDGFGRGR